MIFLFKTDEQILEFRRLKEFHMDFISSMLD